MNQQKNIEDLSDLKNDVIAFAKKILGIEMAPYQKRYLKKLESEKRRRPIEDKADKINTDKLLQIQG